MRIFIGYERREHRSSRVSLASIHRFGRDAQPLYEEHLRYAGLLTRPVDTRNNRWDFTSSAPESTSFAIARFFAPILTHSGWCLFADGDTVFLRDPYELLLKYFDRKYAVMVVKHDIKEASGLKMDGQLQTFYRRKLWSSVMAFNADHPANRRLNTQMLNQWPGRDLHAFNWLHDDEIGELPPEWNWLVGMQPKPPNPAVAHYTLGTPELCPNCEHADIWHDVARVLELDEATQ